MLKLKIILLCQISKRIKGSTLDSASSHILLPGSTTKVLADSLKLSSMKSFSYTVLILALFLLSHSADARARLQSVAAKTTSNVECVVQAFGTDLEDKGIQVQVRDPGFGCGQFSTTPITKSANFVGGEAEVALSLPADNFRICTSAMVIAVTLPYSCDPVVRFLQGADWGGIPASLGDCRALEQKCGNTISTAAIPYIDMWCRRPTSQGGQPEGMRLNWSNNQANDSC